MKLFFFLLLGAVFTQKTSLKGDKVLRITPKTVQEVDALRKWIDSTDLELDLWQEHVELGVSTDVHVSVNDVTQAQNELTSAGLSYEVTVEDLQALVDEEQRDMLQHAYWGGFNYDNYNRYSVIDQQMSTLAERRYSHAKVEKFNVGRTAGGKSINGLKIMGSNSNGRRPAIWLDGAIHAREWITPATMMYLIKNLVEGRSSDATRVLGIFDLYIVPVVNIDGYEFSHTNNRMWRKTRQGCRSDWDRCCGADPNRNWGSHFAGAGTSKNPCSDLYHGGRAFSQPCVAAVAAKLSAIKKNQGLVSYWNVHAYSQLLLTPYGWTTALPPDYNEIERVGIEFQKGVLSTHRRYFQVGPPSRILYSVGGGSMDWTYEKLGVIYSYGPELRPGRGSRGGFVLPTREIRPSGEEFTKGFYRAALAMKY